MSDQATHARHDPQTEPGPPGAGLQARLRLWPGLVLAAVFWLVRVSASISEAPTYKFLVGMLIAPLVALAGIVLWWLLASRLRWSDRLLVVGTLVAVTAVTMVSADASFRGIGLVIYAPAHRGRRVGGMAGAFLSVSLAGPPGRSPADSRRNGRGLLSGAW